MIIKKQYQLPALIIILGLLILAFLWFSQNKGIQLGPTSQAPAPAFQSASDLDNASKELDSTNLNQMDSGINQISSDSSSF